MYRRFKLTSPGSYTATLAGVSVAPTGAHHYVYTIARRAKDRILQYPKN